ncbi:MAG: cysteine desulfurase family protein [Rhodospirillales bacterium]
MDHNATTPVRPEAQAAVMEALALVGNPSSVHGPGRAARRIVEDAREKVAELVGWEPSGVIFTGGGTEANNLAVRGSDRGRVLASAVEHVSVLDATPKVEEIPVDESGVVEVEALDSMLSAGGAPALVSVMAANNETGVLQPVAEVSAVAGRAGALMHCDAVQAAGKMEVDLSALGADMVTLSAHKIGGPAGVGALVIANDAPVAPMIRGGGQERRRRAGTENVAGIAGFGAAAEAALAGLSDFARLAEWRDRIEARLAERAEIKVFGSGTPRLANTTCLTMPGVAAEAQIIALDLLGVAVSAGSACSSGKVEPSHVLQAMGADKAEAATAIRVSLGWDTAEQDIERFISAWAEVRAKMGGKDERTAAA